MIEGAEASVLVEMIRGDNIVRMVASIISE